MSELLETPTTVDLHTTYLGLHLDSPIVASASPLTGEVDSAVLLDAAGVGAIVLPSLFEEDIVAEELMIASALEAGAEHHHEATGYFPPLPDVGGVAERYLTRLEATKRAVKVPVIASLNASRRGSWSRYARQLVDGGADAIELNVYRVAADPAHDGRAIEAAVLELVGEVCAQSSVPVAVKLSPYYSAMASFARAVVDAGAHGLVLFNRFYQPDLDLETMEVKPAIHLSSATELGLPLRWIAILRPQLGAEVALAATSGVEDALDLVKLLAVGADVAMLASELLRSGIGRIGELETGLRAWMAEHEYRSLEELRGSANQASAADGEAFERANYLRTLRSWR